MLTTLSERLRERLTAKRMSDADLARSVGVKPPSVFAWLTGETKSIKGQNLLKAAAALDVTPDWLATGIGRKMVDDDHPPMVRSPERYYGDKTIAEAIEIMESMSSAARVEALSFLKVFAAKKGATSTHGEAVHLPAASKHAA